MGFSTFRASTASAIFRVSPAEAPEEIILSLFKVTVVTKHLALLKFFFSSGLGPGPDRVAYLLFWIYMVQFQVGCTSAIYATLALEVSGPPISTPLSLVLALRFRV